VVETATFLSRKLVCYESIARDGTQEKIQSPQSCFRSVQFVYLPTIMLITISLLKNVVLFKTSL